MVRSGRPLVMAAFINQIGTWVGFTAFVLLWQSFGSQWTVLFMLLSSLGPWALSKKLALRLGSTHVIRNWLFLNASLGLLTGGAAFLTTSPVFLMTALSFIAVIKVTSASYLASMVSTLVSEGHRPATFTRLSTVNCVTLALGPALAGYLLDAWSFRTLILVDAASFFAAAAVIALASRGSTALTPGKPPEQNHTRPGLWRSLGLATPWLGGLSATWCLLGLAGAVFNMAEIPFF